MGYYIETPRLILRDLLPTDDTGIFTLDSDPDVQRYVGNKPLQHIEEARAVIEFINRQYIDNGIGRWAVVEKETNNFIGWAGLKLIKETINAHHNFYDVGYRFIRQYWGKGYATEAAKASIQYAWDIMCLQKLYAFADLQNAVSQKVLQKAGMQFREIFDYHGDAHAWFEIDRPL